MTDLKALKMVHTMYMKLKAIPVEQRLRLAEEAVSDEKYMIIYSLLLTPRMLADSRQQLRTRRKSA